ncbi:MAG: type II toxin-antitoxin system prevent-host-death family antitoxin [Lawsonibacter sp.]|jgi:prevent-host-death family protein|nr:type II toxin-antitoxin system prevent-host-death family antitoxin [Lawsonibacter sp.]MCI9671747.1 type II toxin-antitoxin system prevent-host-death family antitoxin [Lawsonibacter sp.]
MPNIRPSSDLRNNYNEISAFCHQYGEPVYITKNGTGDLAVLSIEAYERLAGRFELYALLEEGLADIRAGRTVDADEALDSILEDLENGTL